MSMRKIKVKIVKERSRRNLRILNTSTIKFLRNMETNFPAWAALNQNNCERIATFELLFPLLNEDGVYIIKKD